MKFSYLCIVCAVLNFIPQNESVAQNPLRHGLASNPYQSPIDHNDSEPERYYTTTSETQDDFRPQNFSNVTDSAEKISPPIFDRNVEGATFTQIPKNESENKPRVQFKNPTAGLASTSVFTSKPNGLLSSKNKLLELVMKISLNLAFVLSIAVGIILMCRKWLANNYVNNSERAVGDSLVVRETLRIDSKTLLRLVQWRSNRFLVASDQNGIQSVKALNLSFDQTLQELDDTSANEEKLIKQLLAGLNQK